MMKTCTTILAAAFALSGCRTTSGAAAAKAVQEQSAAPPSSNASEASPPTDIFYHYLRDLQHAADLAENEKAYVISIRQAFQKLRPESDMAKYLEAWGRPDSPSRVAERRTSWRFGGTCRT